ncbi:putative carbonyl reductase [Xylariales sp. PMI_506]|nr:putative carbonyl reductase [Xylariales sp. PMI_506]
MGFHPDALPDLSGKVYIVTGGTSGIGYYTVARLAEHGAHVYLCARTEEKGKLAISSIKLLYPNTHISLLVMDHLSLSTVVSAAKSILSRETVLHGLVNNAGIMATPFEITKDGYEAQWQTNYLAHWVFTYHLLPLLLKTSQALVPGSVRIVNLSSMGHQYAPNGGINFTDTSLPDGTAMARYGQSKLANILHVKTLHRLYGPASPSSSNGNGEIWSSSIHPGLVQSQLGARAEGMSLAFKAAIKMYSAMGGKVDGDKGAWTSVFCVASPDMKRNQSGIYFQRIAQPGSPSAVAQDLSLSVKLEEWTRSEMAREAWVELRND